MRTFALICVVNLGIAMVAGQQPGGNAPNQAPAIASPEIAADGHVTFRLLAPKASEVTLIGEFVQGSKSLTKDDKGLWSVTVGPIAPEMYHYNFVVDGLRIIDPSNPRLKTGSTPSTLMSILDIRGDHARFYDAQMVPHGEIRTHWYQSKAINGLRRVNVYTPAGYDASQQTRYPVLYLLHGANLDESAWTRFGRVNIILDNLVAAGKAQPFIVVMPFGYGVASDTMPRQGAGGPSQNTNLFSKDLLEDVIPLVESKYRVSTNRDQRAIMGLSMGGGQALGIGLSHLELFSYVGGFSAALRPADFEKTFGNLIQNPDAANKKLHLLWIGCGTEDGLYPAAKSFSEFLDKNNIKHTFHSSGGAHTFMVWRNYLNDVAPLLFSSSETSSGR
ncbi:MAG TPA: alpha/beta hydrolase-fold protein [Bryobacteraceae bacterium]|nr:alpha/beta hydrolase-fold protein [Bryobacteraceae bacterium]